VAELKEQILDVVKIIGYLPDSTFRSCSAARYSGVVYFGNMDESLLDIEESLVHEAGHQVLYRLAEVTPITLPETPHDRHTYFRGRARSGPLWVSARILHFALLAKYFWRRALLGGYHAQDCLKRCLLMILGLHLARPMLESDPNLSEQGLLIVRELCSDIDDLQEAIASSEVNRLGESRVH
jgi:hypothetical protein